MTRGEGLLVVLVGVLASCAWGQVCEPAWDGTHTSGELDDTVLSMYAWEEGFPGSLIVGGAFEMAGGVPALSVARWDGERWHAMGEGMDYQELSRGEVLAFTAFDWDGQGEALFAGGRFDSADGIAAENLARWDGDGWVPIPTGMNGRVYSLTTFDQDGDGPAPEMLYAGGSFGMVDGSLSGGIARWDGQRWEALGYESDGVVKAMITLDPDGPGPDPESLFVIGVFTHMAGEYSPGIIRFDGESWHPLPDYALAGFAHDASLYDPDGSGPARPVIVIVGNDFTAHFLLAAYNGTAWTERITDERVAGTNMLAVWQPGTDRSANAGVYIKGDFDLYDGSTDFIRWTPGEGWVDLPVRAGWDPGAMFAWDPDGDGGIPTRLMVGGRLSSGTDSYPSIAAWDGVGLSRLGGGVLGKPQLFALAEPLTPFDAGVYLAGDLQAFDDFDPSGALRWDGRSWEDVDWPFEVGDGRSDVLLSAWDPDADGPLEPLTVAAGEFESINGEPVKQVASWTGTAWEQMGDGIDEGDFRAVRTLTTWDPDGSGPEIPRVCIAGGFTNSGGRDISSAAEWDGEQWVMVGQGIGLGGGSDEVIKSLVAADVTGQVGGEDPLLYAASSQFTIRRLGQRVSVAQWDGTAWTPIAASPLDGWVTRALVIERDLPEPDELYVVGYFDGFNGQDIEGIAQWDGSQWHPVGPAQHGRIRDAAVVDGTLLGADGNVILATGEFDDAHVAWWDGADWHPLFKMRGLLPRSPNWYAVSYDEDQGGPAPPALHFVGEFDWIDTVSARGYERLACMPAGCYADYDGNGSVNTADFIAYLNDWVGRLGRADCDDNGVVDTRDFVCFLGAWSAGC